MRQVRETERRQGESMEKGVERWAVDISEWNPTSHQFSFALSLLPQHHHSSITRSLFFSLQPLFVSSENLKENQLPSILSVLGTGELRVLSIFPKYVHIEIFYSYTFSATEQGNTETNFTCTIYDCPFHGSSSSCHHCSLMFCLVAENMLEKKKIMKFHS